MSAAGGPFAKEMAVRKRIQAIYNKLQDDFPSLREYNDYLEQVEDIVFRLVEGIDVAATEAEVRTYEASNRDGIAAARAKRLFAEGKMPKSFKSQPMTYAERRAAELRAAALPPKPGESSVYQLIEQQARDQLEMATDFASAAAAGAGELGGAFAPRPMGLQPVPVHHTDGTAASLTPEQREARILKGQKAGGWTVEISHRRAVEEAFGSLWVS
ncbi:hypothetical protein CLOP_g12241 [Closterium sp. NIES-67]|nr:hypothetical protein CLOP_g12241 [Closterium sp. NIES-67]